MDDTPPLALPPQQSRDFPSLGSLSGYVLCSTVPFHNKTPLSYLIGRTRAWTRLERARRIGCVIMCICKRRPKYLTV